MQTRQTEEGHLPHLAAWLLGIITMISILAPTRTMAQCQEIINPQIASLQVTSGSDWQSLPISQLGGNAIHIDFDELSHDYHRYTYQIEHCEADWSSSNNIYESDYMQGYNDILTIEQMEQSINTTHLYTHYSITIPNEKCRLTMSGNYKLHVKDDETGEEVLTACFMIVEPIAKIGINYTTNTDIDINKSHQQVQLNVLYGNLRVTNSSTQIKTTILQNGRWDNAVNNPKPDYIRAEGLQWLHSRQLIYEAGNIYHKFELLDLDHPTMGIDEIKWDGECFHAFTIPDQPRPNYVFDESPQGSFLIRNSDNSEINTTCDYAQVHFKLTTKRQLGEVYLNGDWTNDQFTPKYQMTYNDSDHSYQATVLLKQGFYSYQYLVKDGEKVTTVNTEGNFYQTKNKYDALVYYRGTGDRTDRLVGWASTK